MKKIIIYALFITFNFVNAQKADTEKKTIKVKVPKSEYFKNIKTYDLIVQGDENWNQKLADPKKMTFQHNVGVSGNKTDLVLDSENPDLKIIIGSGDFKYGSANNQNFLDANLKYLIVGKNNEIVYQSGAPSKYYGANPNSDITLSLINDLKNIIKKFSLTNSLINNEKELEIHYGFFDKAKDFPELEEYNIKTNEFISNIEANKLTENYLNKLQTYYTTFVGKEYKKIKVKDYNKVIYLNLSLLEMLKGNINLAQENYEKAKDGAGFLSIWPIMTKANIRDLSLVNQNTFSTKIENFTYDSAYYININGTIMVNDKEEKGLIKVGRYCDTSQSNIVDLDLYAKPKVLLYNDKNELVFKTVGTEKIKIKTDKGLELFFMKYDSEYLLVEINSEGNYKKYENTSKDVYMIKDAKLILKK